MYCRIFVQQCPPEPAGGVAVGVAKQLYNYYYNSTSDKAKYLFAWVESKVNVRTVHTCFSSEEPLRELHFKF